MLLADDNEAVTLGRLEVREGRHALLPQVHPGRLVQARGHLLLRGGLALPGRTGSSLERWRLPGFLVRRRPPVRPGVSRQDVVALLQGPKVLDVQHLQVGQDLWLEVHGGQAVRLGLSWQTRVKLTTA